MYRLAAVLIVITLLSGCGSDSIPATQTSSFTTGATTPPPPTPPSTPGEAQGAYSGTFSSPFSASFHAIVLPNDMFYAIYDDGNCENEFARCGVMVGQGVSNAGKYKATLHYYDWGGNSDAQSPLDATYVPGVSLSGAITLPNGITYNVTGTAIPPSEFNYNVPANLTNVVGTWPATTMWPGTANVTVATDGTFTGLLNSCAFSGTMSPDPNKNFSRVTLTSGSAPCTYPNQTGTGIAVETLLPDATTRRLVMGAPVGGWFMLIISQR
jgi:uncharacterized protein YceK